MEPTYPIWRRPCRPAWVFRICWGLHGRLDSDLFPIAFRALHLLDWSQKTRFCKRCGNEMRPKASPPARECLSCGYQSFPPRILTGGDRPGRTRESASHGRSPSLSPGVYSVWPVLWSREKRWKKPSRGRCSKKWGSNQRRPVFRQPALAFPHSLMIGFTAQYAGGEIRIRWGAGRCRLVHRGPPAPARENQHRSTADRVVRGKAPIGAGRLILQG